MGGYQEGYEAGRKAMWDDLWSQASPAEEQTLLTLARCSGALDQPDEYQRPETSEECTRMMRHLNGPDSHCMDPAAHERADRLARIAKVYPAAAAEARER